MTPDARPDRRDVLTALGGGLTLAGAPALARAQATGRERDWAWLVGDWDVSHRRLRRRLAGDAHWDAFGGRSAVWLTMGGLGTIDDNLLDLPGGVYRATGIRAFDPVAGKWLIWWLDGRNPTRIDPPVYGTFDGDEGVFLGEDVFEGRPIRVRFRWHEIHGPRPHWDQAFSPDGGATWEINWTNAFTRVAPAPAPLPVTPDHPKDFDFLVGRWRVAHRRLKTRLAGSSDWETFDGTLENWPVLGGQGNVGDNLFDRPSGPVRGVGLRAFDPASGDWLSWWLDGRAPSVIGAPLRGRFTDGVGVFRSEETVDGRRVLQRVVWSDITARSARWEQASSLDGVDWEVNWISVFERTA
jgi:hypothetical protein